MNIKRYYNQNKKKVWGIIIIIASLFIVFNLALYIYGQSKKPNQLNENNTYNEINNNKNITLETKQSTVSGEILSDDKLKNATDVIDKFISYCNEKNLQEAYELLTEECKEQMYNTVQIFEQYYYNNVFGGTNKAVTVENWINNTYKVKISEDMLSTGKTNNGFSKQDYITVKKVDDKYKLNINNYIGYTSINQTTKKNGIEMQVVERNIYMDYEEYIIKAKNDTQDTILLDGRRNVKSLYLEDTKGATYSSYSHELTDSTLRIESGHTKQINIKFYSSYVSTKMIKYIVFSDLIKYNGQLSEKEEFMAQV